MKEFFHGWRRKAGLATLVVACVALIGWARSYEETRSLVRFKWGEYFYFVLSSQGVLYWGPWWVIPYWSLVLLLTLLAACLILWRPRKRV